MMATETVVTRATIEAAIVAKRAKQDRMPKHWIERREQIAVELEALIEQWLKQDK